jgi:hypothetical protein
MRDIYHKFDDGSDYLIRSDAIMTRRGLVYDTIDRNFVLEVVDALCDYESIQIYDYRTRQYLTIHPRDLNDRKPVLRQINAILKEHGIRPRRSPRGR